MKHPRLRDSHRLITRELYPINEIPDELITRIAGSFVYLLHVGRKDASGDAFYVVDNEKADLYLSPKSASEYKGKLEFAKDILGFIQDTDDPLSWWPRLYSGMLHCNYESLCKRIEEYDEEDERYEEFRQAYLDDAREAWEKYSAAREEYIKKYGCEGLNFGLDAPYNDEDND